MPHVPEIVIFVIRASLTASGLHGVVERVSTGAKFRFEAADAIGGIISQVVEAEAGCPGSTPTSG